MYFQINKSQLHLQMAKIEVSLSTLGLQQQQQQQQLPQRRKRNCITPTSRSLHSVSQHSAVGGNHRETYQVKEVDSLRQSLKDKEHLILKYDHVNYRFDGVCQRV